MCIDFAYNVFEHQVLACAESVRLSPHMRRIARRRSLIALGSFIAATIVAIFAPRIGFGLICVALLLHLRPEARGLAR